jgi:MFS family permease
MVESFGVPKNQVAFYAGLTSAVFSICQCFTAVLWGRASDTYGRKPAILLGLSSTMITTIMFGFSRSLAMAITVRAFTGLGNGNVGIIRTSVAEMVPQKELQPRAFSVMPLVWTIGSIFGPGFGGSLANPAERHPGLFGGSRLFKTFPYALPNLVTAVLFLVGLTTGVLFMKVCRPIRFLGVFRFTRG